MKHLYDSLRTCQKEEEVKAEFCKFFKMKIFALRGIDHYTEGVLFEFKYDRNFKSPENVARVLAQTMYYARLLKYGAGLTRYPLPPVICVVDRNEAFFAETKDYAKFYAAKGEKYDWDRAPSTPCPKLVADVLDYLTQRRGGAEDCSQTANDTTVHKFQMANIGICGNGGNCEQLRFVNNSPLPYIYDLTSPAEEEQFTAKCREFLTRQATFLELLDKKAITEDNFLDVFDYWDGLFGAYVRNGRKSSEYFFADIEQGKSIVAQDGQVLFSVSGAEGYIPKTLQPDKYRHFWQGYEKVQPSAMTRIRQKADRLTEDFRRRFTGEFYTPVEFAAKGLDYLERTIGREWWKTGEWRFWDMAAGTGNLEFNLPSSALPYCYISTLDAEDVDYCRRIFPAATCFQYDYLADDAAALGDALPLGYVRKMPPKLAADLANPDIKWVIFINPPFATANNVGDDTGKKSKDAVSMTSVRSLMNADGYGEASRELFTQFLFRISKEFKDRQARLCMFSPLKYLNSNNDQKIRDGFFQYQYERGFIFPSKAFEGTTADFPVGFLVWNLAKRTHLSDQEIILDVFDLNAEKIGTKRVPSVSRDQMLNKWCPRPKWDGKSIMPTFSSGIKVMDANKDQRNHVAPGFICSVSSKGDDFQNQNSVFILSAPYANAGAFSVTPENFERAMVLYTVKKIPAKNWTNDKDTFYAPANPVKGSSADSAPLREDQIDPATGLPFEFVTDCVIWAAFSNKNNCAALKDVKYQGDVWQIPNQMFPFLLDEVRQWPCAHSGIAAQLASANEDRFLAKWLAGKALSPEASAVLDAARRLYREFYANITRTPWMDWKIETWDVGYYQIRNAMNDAGGLTQRHGGTERLRDETNPLAALHVAHAALGVKILPQIYALGFLNPDVEYYK